MKSKDIHMLNEFSTSNTRADRRPTNSMIGIHKQKQQRVTKWKLKICALLAIVATILILSLQARESDAKKIKLKDLKKAKKYAILLAGQRKKLYAIPFPVPLPVFIKRQHIYTQVPVVPKYVQQPSYYGSSSSSMEVQDSYGSTNANLLEMKVPESSYYGIPHMKSTYSSTGSSASYTPTPTRGKYLSSFANALVNPKSNYQQQRDVVGKLLTGQAKVLSPKSLISSLTSSKTLKEIAAEQEEKTPPSSSSPSSSSSSSSSPSSALTAYLQDSSGEIKPSANSTTSAGKESGAKESASENYMSMFKPMMSPRRRPRPPKQHRPRPVPRQFYPANLYRVPGVIPYAPYLAGRPIPTALVPQMVPVIQAPARLQPSELLGIQTEQQLLEAAAAIPPVGGSGDGSNGELEVSSAQEHETVSETAKQNSREQQLVEAMKILQLRRQQALLRAALIREREVAETNAALIRAHSLGQVRLVDPQQLRLVNY